MGPGEAVGGMRKKINTGYSCYLAVAHRRWGPGAAVGGMRIEINTDLYTAAI